MPDDVRDGDRRVPLDALGRPQAVRHLEGGARSVAEQLLDAGAPPVGHLQPCCDRAAMVEDVVAVARVRRPDRLLRQPAEVVEVADERAGAGRRRSGPARRTPAS